MMVASRPLAAAPRDLDMNRPPVPLPLLILFGFAAVAAIVFFAIFVPGRAAANVQGVVRVRFVGADGKPRADVQAMLFKTVADEIILLPISDAEGQVEGEAAVGSYELRVYPERLATASARAKFLRERRGDPSAIERVRYFVMRVEATRDPGAGRRDALLPRRAGY
jgi:hypothetical protein